MKTRRILSVLKPGDVCTGTIARFNLQSSRLAAAGIIADVKGEWVFQGYKRR